MRKINYYRMLLGGISLLGLANAVQAQCVTPPTCSELGYTKTASECSGHTFLKCPFDMSVGYCDLGTSSSNSGNTTTVTCPTGYLTFAELYPFCNETNTMKMIQHSTNKDCYKCKKCTSGFWIDPGSCGLGDERTDSAGCKACTECTWSSDTLINGRCIKD